MVCNVPSVVMAQISDSASRCEKYIYDVHYGTIFPICAAAHRRITYFPYLCSMLTGVLYKYAYEGAQRCAPLCEL